MTVLEQGATVQVPAEVAKCPYCDGSLTASFEAWEEEADGSWSASETELTCEHEPPIDSKEWRGFMEEHTYMPYVYWLPVTMTVLEWVKEHYRFEM